MTLCNSGSADDWSCWCSGCLDCFCDSLEFCSRHIWLSYFWFRSYIAFGMFVVNEMCKSSTTPNVHVNFCPYLIQGSTLACLDTISSQEPFFATSIHLVPFLQVPMVWHYNSMVTGAQLSASLLSPCELPGDRVYFCPFIPCLAGCLDALVVAD